MTRRTIDRRDFLTSTATAMAALLVGTGSLIDPSEAAALANFTVNGEFSRQTVVDLARGLAKAAYVAPDTSLPGVLDALTYDQYRDIRFKPDTAIWAEAGLPFQMQLFHRGFYYKDPVEVGIVTGGQSNHLAYNPDLFSIGPLVPQPVPNEDIGFSGIRLHGRINRPDYYDEIVVFQGASYFRSLGRGQVYGLSSRGLAIKTADPEGEEFPIFRAFWVETPVPETESIVVHALLDSPSTAGAYRFTIRPGFPTLMDVEVQLFPRVTLDKVGLAPGTSMFYFSANGRENIDDFRPEVHDSDGLLMVTGRGERLWRPLQNPQELQISAFVDTSPRGFGLIQRAREFADYEDLEAAYERRPTLWVEPVGDWGAGAVTLVEIPTTSEIHDNIVAYWSPRTPIQAGSEYSFSYRLAWGGDTEVARGSAMIAETRSGRASIGGPSAERLFVIEYRYFEGVDRAALGQPRINVSTSKGKISNVVLQDNPRTGGSRLSFVLDPEGETIIELRAELGFETGMPAETWVYRWTS